LQYTTGEVVGKIEGAPGHSIATSLESYHESTVIGDSILPVNINKPELIKCTEIKGDVSIENIQGEIGMPVDTLIKTKDTLQKNPFTIGKIKRK
jgi:hypothetical protein